MIAVVDYRVGNIRSVLTALNRLDVEGTLTDDPDVLGGADGIILPGVGAFAAAMEELHGPGLDEILRQAVQRGTPLLGICLGMQVLFSESEEHGRHEGLDLVNGRLLRFEGQELTVPHMGWNQVSIQRDDCPLFDGIEDESYFYFAHSYYPAPSEEKAVAGTTDYGGEFCSTVWSGTVFATQFHPEKSGECGERMLQNFAEFCGEE